jgi:Secretion system C-terminal sorting domain
LGFVSLKVYDILGNEVATLVNEIKDAGNHIAIFNSVKSTTGLYFYTLKSGENVETKKMIVLK